MIEKHISKVGTINLDISQQNLEHIKLFFKDEKIKWKHLLKS